MVSAFEGNKAETKTMLPVIQAFTAARHIRATWMSRPRVPGLPNVKSARR
jgi:hypothetical protein